jgi:hypothetical protein
MARKQPAIPPPADDEDFLIPTGAPAVDPARVFASVEFLKVNTPAEDIPPLTAEDVAWVEQTRAAGHRPSAPPSLAAQRYLEENLSHYNFDLPVTQTQWQNFVLTKLFQQANDPDTKTAKAALDTLAKTSVVGLMIEKTEVSITHRTSEELNHLLKSAMDKYVRHSNERVIEGVVSRA